MLNWNFKDTISYQGETTTQDSRKFEFLVEVYLKKRFPLENWRLTKATRDGNRDLENFCEFSGTSMWAEVKYTIHTDENISSRKYDSTLVSSMFEKNLIKIFFISSTSMGNNLIERIKKFYYLSTVKKIAFVDGYALAYWLKKNSDVETFFFNTPVNYTPPTAPNVQLQCIRILYESDSYTIDSVLEDEVVYPLYLSNNYILEGEFTAYGFDTTPLFLYCNNELLYKETVPPEITTFSLNLGELEEEFDINKEFSLDIYYKLHNKRIDCGNYKLRFASLGRIFSNQSQVYISVQNGIKSANNKMYNIYGPHGSGKSWLLNNLKNDTLKRITPDKKIIYINFTGQMTDGADICRLIFTLVFNFYSLSISATAFTHYCRENSIANSFFNSKNIELLIQALQDEDYLTIQKTLCGSIFSKTKKIFEACNDFAYERIYFIDNVNLLNETNYSIFKEILNAFNPRKNISFVIAGREPLDFSNMENIPLEYIEDAEILGIINECIPFTVNNLNEIVPNKHYLKYPGLLHSFAQEIGSFHSSREIKQFYIDSFYNNAVRYIKGTFVFDDVLLLLICIMKDGVPYAVLQELAFNKIKYLLGKKYIIHNGDYVYPNFEIWNKYIPPKVIEDYKEKIVPCLQNFMVRDKDRKELYQCALIEYYPQYYNLYFDSIYEYIDVCFKNNKYSKVLSLCESLKKGSVYYGGPAEKIENVKYFLAFSYMHCDISQKALGIFYEITSNYKLKAKDNLYFKAEAQIIDAKYWSFQEFKTLPAYINEFRKSWSIIEPKNPQLEARSFLTATNRMMVTYLALDKIRLANKWLQKNVRLAIKYESDEHLGYTYMDYAKGIYHLNLSLALKYLELADLHFQMPSEHRRHLDCQCEIQYVKFLLGTGSIEQLQLSQEALFENQYWIQYYKCHLKLSVCYILMGKREEALQHLLEAEAPTIMKNDERIKYLCCMIGTFLYSDPIPYENLALAGTSYHKIIRNTHLNFKQSNAVIYNAKETSPSYNLDPRVW